MVGQRDRNLRQGDIAEQLGILLLQGLAAVAPVPRTEDTGIDVVTTLLRRDGRRLFAEDTFYVQLKASSVVEVPFKGAGIDWLCNLELPFFIGSVDLMQSQISLYSAHALYEQLASTVPPLPEETLRVLLLPGSPAGWDAEGERRLHFGPPVLEWNLGHLSDESFLEHAYNILKTHLRMIQDGFVHRLAGFHIKTKWQSGEMPRLGNPSQACGTTAALHQILDQGWPFLHGWYFHLCVLQRSQEADELLKLMQRMKDLDWKIPKAAMMMTHGLAAFFSGWPAVTQKVESAAEAGSPQSTHTSD